MNKKFFLSLCAGTLCTSIAAAVAPVSAFANVSLSSMRQKAIVYNQDVISKPDGFAHNNTTYMPIWYLMQTLEKVNIHSEWKNNTWEMTTSSKPNFTNIKPSYGKCSIKLNGVVVQHIDSIVAKDPASGKATTYMPVWYVMKVLERLGIHSNWEDGTVWQMYTGAQAPSLGNLDIKVDPRPPAERAAPSFASNLGDEIVKYAESFIGTPYRYGGTSASGFDCSGLVKTVFAHFGKDLPRTAAEQAGVGSVISKSSLQPGDLVFFNTEGSEFSHVGIYVGDNKFISATSSHGVKINNLNDPYYWGSRFTRATNPGL